MTDNAANSFDRASDEERANLLSVLIKISKVGIVLIDQSHRVIDANPAFADMLGYTMEELLNLHTWDWESAMSTDAIQEEFADLTTIQTTFESLHRRKDGSTYPVEVSASGTTVNGQNTVLRICTDITERKLLEEKLHYIGHHDILTGLPNRYAFEQYLEKLSADLVLPIAILICDMNGLKNINDRLGHQAGDLGIKACADLLSATVGADGFCARLGGDEFVIVLPGAGIHEVQQLRRLIYQKTEQINQAGSVLNFLLKLAIGVAVATEAPVDKAALFHQADQDMYRHKIKLKLIAEAGQETPGS